MRCGALGAIVGTVDAGFIGSAPSLEHIRTHDAVLRAAVESGLTVVPTRFAQTFANDDEPCTHLENRPQLVRVLEEFAGCVEMHLVMTTVAGKLDWARTDTSTRREAAVDEASGPGREYLETLREAMSSSPGFALKHALGPVVVAESVTSLADGRGASFAHLVRREHLPAYRAAVAAFPALAEARLEGPLPLYTFSGVQ